MNSTKPKRALLAYCALAERLSTPGVGVMQALTPFLADICKPFAGTMFDAKAFADALNLQYDLKISRLATLGLAEQLAKEGLLKAVSGYANSAVYQYSATQPTESGNSVSPISEAEVEGFFRSFVLHCKKDSRIHGVEDSELEEALLDRLLNVDSMRLLSRREASIATKIGPDTLVLNKIGGASDPVDSKELHFDFLVSEFLLSLRNNNPGAFELASNVAFASMAAEAIACFREPTVAGDSLEGLTIYLDAPLLLDMLGVNSEYLDYGKELLDAIKLSGVTAAVFDHSVEEAEAAVHAQLSYLRSGFNQVATGWGITTTPALLNALARNVGERAEQRLGLVIHRNPEANLHRRAQSTVGDIEVEMNRRMQHWKNPDAKAYDRKSIWTMLATRDTTSPCPRICDSKFLFLTRNTSLVSIANNAWTAWLKGATTHSRTHVDKWAPVAMSDKQFAGYLWTRVGGSNAAIPKARLIAHCSAAVRPRADVKARAYNLALELHGKQEADDLAALLEDREGGRALMRATLGDPEDVTHARLPFILEKVKIAAGEFAAAKVRAESESQLKFVQEAHEAQIQTLQTERASFESTKKLEEDAAQKALFQQQQINSDLEIQKLALASSLAEQLSQQTVRKNQILKSGLIGGCRRYKLARWGVATGVGLLTGATTYLASIQPLLASCIAMFLGVLCFWFVPEYFDGPLNRYAMNKLREIVTNKDEAILIPNNSPDFKNGKWEISSPPYEEAIYIAV